MYTNFFNSNRLINNSRQRSEQQDRAIQSRKCSNNQILNQSLVDINPIYQVTSKCISNALTRRKWDMATTHIEIQNQFELIGKLPPKSETQNTKRTKIKWQSCPVSPKHRPLSPHIPETGRTITLIVIKEPRLFAEMILKNCLRQESLRDYLLRGLNSKWSQQVSVQLLHVKSLLFLQINKRSNFFINMLRHPRSYAAEWKDLLVVANSQRLTGGWLGTLSDDSMNVLYQGEATQKTLVLDLRNERQNELFYERCPNFVLASKTPLNIILKNKQVRVGSSPLESNASMLGDTSRILGNKIKNRSPTPTIDSNTNHPNIKSYIRNFGSMKNTSFYVQPKVDHNSFFTLFKVDNEHLFYEILFQCQDIFYDYSKSDLEGIANQFLNIIIQKNKLVTYQWSQATKKIQNQKAKRDYYLWLIRNVLRLSMNQLLNYAVYLSRTQRSVKDTILYDLNGDPSVTQDFNQPIIRWRHFVRFQYQYIDWKWGMKDKTNFIGLYLTANQQSTILEERVLDLGKNLENRDKSEQQCRRLLNILSKFNTMEQQIQKVNEFLKSENMITVEENIRGILCHQIISN